MNTVIHTMVKIGDKLIPCANVSVDADTFSELSNIISRKGERINRLTSVFVDESRQYDPEEEYF